MGNLFTNRFYALYLQFSNVPIVADPRFTYQKANQIVLQWFVPYEQKNEVSIKINENFKSIHYIYSLFFPKIYNRINQFGIKNKSDFELAFSLFKLGKQTRSDPNQQSIKTFFAKDPAVYEKCETVHENEQKPELWAPTKKFNSPTLPRVRGKSKELMDEKTAEKKTELKRSLDENTEKMEMIKKMKNNTVVYKK